MKQFMIVVYLFCSILLNAQRKVTYVKLERTPCYGTCPVYTLEIFSTGLIKYNGVRNAAFEGSKTYRVGAANVRSLFRYIESNKISVLKSEYEAIAADIPKAHLTFIISKKQKKIRGAESGPSYLKAIGKQMDEIFFKHALKVPQEEEIQESQGQLQNDIKQVSPEEEGVTIYNYVEQMPEFPGGSVNLNQFIHQNMNYPLLAQEEGVQGKVICKFIINEDGSISNVDVVKSLSKECDAEAIRVVKKMPNWKPGKQNGKAVKTQMNLPFSFNLQ